MNTEAGNSRDPAAPPFSGVAVGTAFGPVSYAVSEAANDRYWRAAGIEHPARTAGFLYPPMAANLTILAFQTDRPRSPAPHPPDARRPRRRRTRRPTSRCTGRSSRRFAKRGREYVEVTTEVATDDGTHLWTSIATFVEAGA